MKFLSILLFVFSITGCFNNGVKMDDYNKVDKHWRERSELVSLSAIVDSVYSFGYDSSFLLLPDSDLLVELYLSPTIIILDSNSKAVGVSVCNAHFPNFKKKVINKLNDYKYDIELDNKVQAQIEHITTITGEKFSVKKGKKYTIILGYVQSKNGFIEKKFLNDIKGSIPTNEIDYKFLVAVNYQELMFNDFSFQKRNIQYIRKMEGTEFPKKVLDEFDID